MSARALLFVVIASFVFVPGTAIMTPDAVWAQSSDPAWLDDLKDQLQFEKQCKVSYLMNMREGQLGGKNTYEARVQCEDGRMFDANRVGQSGMFEFKACETQVC
ncbi:MAG: hypothetical protein LJE67_09095 [Salaquimonas sp.]|jgi:hypothetical protein|nr:hypothetical protein [Salaquimonas sp.]